MADSGSNRKFLLCFLIPIGPDASIPGGRSLDGKPEVQVAERRGGATVGGGVSYFPQSPHSARGERRCPAATLPVCFPPPTRHGAAPSQAGAQRARGGEANADSDHRRAGHQFPGGLVSGGHHGAERAQVAQAHRFAVVKVVENTLPQRVKRSLDVRGNERAARLDLADYSFLRHRAHKRYQYVPFHILRPHILHLYPLVELNLMNVHMFPISQV